MKKILLLIILAFSTLLLVGCKDDLLNNNNEIDNTDSNVEKENNSSTKLIDGSYYGTVCYIDSSISSLRIDEGFIISNSKLYKGYKEYNIEEYEYNTHFFDSIEQILDYSLDFKSRFEFPNEGWFAPVNSEESRNSGYSILISKANTIYIFETILNLETNTYYIISGYQLEDISHETVDVTYTEIMGSPVHITNDFKKSINGKKGIIEFVVAEGSSGNRHTLDITVDENVLNVDYHLIERGQTCDMAYWIVRVEVNLKQLLKIDTLKINRDEEFYSDVSVNALIGGIDSYDHAWVVLNGWGEMRNVSIDYLKSFDGFQELLKAEYVEYREPTNIIKEKQLNMSGDNAYGCHFYAAVDENGTYYLKIYTNQTYEPYTIESQEIIEKVCLLIFDIADLKLDSSNDYKCDPLNV